MFALKQFRIVCVVPTRGVLQQPQHPHSIFYNATSHVIVQVMDYGYPQFTEAKILSEYIKTDAYKMEVTPYVHLCRPF